MGHYFMVSMRLENGRNHIFWTFWAKNFSFFKKIFIFTICFLDVSDHFKSYGTHSWRLFFLKFHCKFLMDLAYVQSDACACSCLSFFEIECNNYTVKPRSCELAYYKNLTLEK